MIKFLSIALLVTTLNANTILTSLKGSVYLHQGDSPYIIDENLFNNTEDTLTIEGGVVLKFRNYTKLLLRGHIRFLGTPQKNIVFHAENPSNHWVGLHINGSQSPIVMNYVVIMNGFKNSFLNVHGTLKESQFINNHYGVWIENSKDVHISGGSFTENRYGITVANGEVSVKGATIENNAFGTYLEMDGVLKLTQSVNKNNRIMNAINMSQKPITEKKIAKSIWKSIETTF
ncbi:MAG: hypothetical protein OCC49_06860 [Fibrobacterales bacterium]